MKRFLFLFNSCSRAGVFRCTHRQPGVGQPVSFKTADGGTIHALLYGHGGQTIVLAHGAVFNKERWEPFAQHLSAGGFLVPALDFRGCGRSVAGSKPSALHEDL